MASPEIQSAKEYFDPTLENGEQQFSGEKLEFSSPEKEQGVREAIEEWSKAHDLPDNISDIESRIEDIEISIKQLEVIADTSKFAKEEIQKRREEKNTLEGAKTLLKRVGLFLGVGLATVGTNIGGAEAFYKQGNLQTAEKIDTEETHAFYQEGNLQKAGEIDTGITEDENTEDNLDTQEPLEEQNLTQEEGREDMEDSQDLSSDLEQKEQESSFLKQAQELLHIAQERDSQYLDNIQGMVTAIEEQTLTEEEMEQAIAFGKKLLNLDNMSNQEDQEYDYQPGELVNFGFVYTPEKEGFQATVAETGTGVYFTEDENCIQTVEHVVSEGEDQELYFYYGELRNIGDNIYDQYHIIRHPQADYAIMIEKSPEAGAACQDYLEHRGQEVPADLKDFAQQYQDEILTHIGNRDRDAESHEEEQFHQKPYQLDVQVTQYSAYEVIPDFINANDSIAAEDFSHSLVTFTSENTAEGNSGSPIFNQQGEVVGAHQGRISLELLQDALDNEQEKDNPERDKIKFLQEAIEHTKNGGSMSIIVPFTQETQKDMLEQFPKQE